MKNKKYIGSAILSSVSVSVLVFLLSLHTASLLFFSQFQVWLIKEKVFRRLYRPLTSSGCMKEVASM